jgi:hypothetical protein
VIIGVSSFFVTFAVAMIGIFLDAKELKVKLALAGFATASFILAIFVQVQAARDADFTKRSLGRLIQASTPSNLFARAVTRIAMGQASKRGLSNCLVLQRTKDDGYIIEIVFMDKAERQAEGYYQFDHEQLAQWSLLEEKSLADGITTDMFKRGPAPTADLLEHWNELAEFIGAIGEGLYPDPVWKFGTSAILETVEIGVPYPHSVPTVISGQTRERLLGGEPVRFLMFSKQELNALVAQSNIAASKIIAGWLAAAWGMPIVLRPAGPPQTP